MNETTRRHPAGAGRLLAGGGLCLFLLLGAGLTLLHAMSDVTIIRAEKLPANLALLYGMLACAVLIGVCGPLRAALAASAQRGRPSGFTRGSMILLTAGGIVRAPNTLAVTAALTSGEAATAAWQKSSVRTSVAATASGSLRVALRLHPCRTLSQENRSARKSIPGRIRTSPTCTGLRAWKRRSAGGPGGLGGHSRNRRRSGNSGLGKAAFVRSNTGPNATYDAYWLTLIPEVPLTGPVRIMFVPAPGPDRLLPQWVQRALLGLRKLSCRQPAGRPPARQTLRPASQSSRTRACVFYPIRAFLLLITSPILTFPAYPAADGPLTAVFISLDGVSWHSIPFR